MFSFFCFTVSLLGRRRRMVAFLATACEVRFVVSLSLFWVMR